MDLFEVFLTKQGAAERLLSEDIKESTGAQVMTPEMAQLAGLEGVPDDPEGRPRVLIACRPADVRLIHTRLERNEEVAGFKLHQLG